MPVPWLLFQPGPNLLEFLPDNPGDGPPPTLAGLKLTSGSINDLDFIVPEPGTSLAALLGFIGAFAAR